MIKVILIFLEETKEANSGQQKSEKSGTKCTIANGLGFSLNLLNDG